MRVFLHRKIKVHKTSARAARKRRIAEIEKMVSGLTLNQLDDLVRYVKVRREAH